MQPAAIALLSSFFLPNLFAQEIVLDNPSFEDVPIHSLPPSLWTDCGTPGETPPDVQPSGAWGVYRPAFHGNTYLGMVTRENGTFEALGQRLKQPLRKGQCYRFSAHLCMSADYWSAVVPATGADPSNVVWQNLPRKNFSHPIIFEVVGTNGNCAEGEVLCSSPAVDHQEWKKYAFTFTPTKQATHLVIRAHINRDSTKSYNGNLLVDHLSPITMTDCVGRPPAVIESTGDDFEAESKVSRPSDMKVQVDQRVPTKSRETARLLSLILEEEAMQEHLTPGQLTSLTVGVKSNSDARFPIGSSHDRWKFVVPSDRHPHFEIIKYEVGTDQALVEFSFGQVQGLAKFRGDGQGLANLTKLKLIKK
ncbi:MAG: hypothetical protein KTR24_13590 [Saprospiraceae bacterium]|nr:hypothetical protein [Saprospiraceae bacterium]